MSTAQRSPARDEAWVGGTRIMAILVTRDSDTSTTSHTVVRGSKARAEEQAFEACKDAANASSATRRRRKQQWRQCWQRSQEACDTFFSSYKHS